MKKHAKGKKSAAASPVDQDIVGLITTLVERLVSLETKVDTLLSRTSARPVEAPRQQAMPSHSAHERRDARIMHKAICADCNKECEVPFKPTGDRPVYCQPCFAKRRARGPFKEKHDIKPQAAAAVKERHPGKPAIAEKRKAALKKKPVARKKKR